MLLLDLPPELLTLIFQQIGPSHLRSSVSYLLISRAWYRIAHPVYLSSLQLSTLYLSSHDLERLPPQDSILGKLIQSKITRLSLRLIGHPSKQIATEPWHTWSSDDGINDSDSEMEDDVWTTAIPVISGERRKSYNWTVEEQRLLTWRQQVNNKLAELACWLPAAQGLEELSFEASSEHEGTVGPRWDYILAEPVKNLISALPVGLKKLTFDTSGSIIVNSENYGSPAHICPLIATRIHQFQRVRLRMRHICPQVFKTLTEIAAGSKLQSLVIRLCIPFFPPAVYEEHDGTTEFQAQPCNAEELPFFRVMSKAGIAFAKSTPSLKILRISFKRPGASSVDLQLIDCINERYMYDPYDTLAYEDEGRGLGRLGGGRGSLDWETIVILCQAEVRIREPR